MDNNVMFELADRFKDLKERKKQKEDLIGKLKDGHEEYKEKAHLVEMLKSKMVINVIKDIMIKEGFSYRCPTCLDLSGQYGRPIQSYPKYNK